MDNLISRQAVLEKLLDAENHAFNSYYKGLVKAHRIIADMPIVQPESKKGLWIIEPGYTVMHCDSCGWAFEYYTGLEQKWNYCPHCGAKMKG